MLADHLDTFFSEHPEFEQRQAFMRRAWLIKTSRGNARLWKNPAWRERAHRWGYSPSQIKALRWPNQWPLTRIINEHHRTVAEFAHALSFLGELGRDSDFSSAIDTPEVARKAEFSQRLQDTRTVVLQHRASQRVLYFPTRSTTLSGRHQPHELKRSSATLEKIPAVSEYVSIGNCWR